ncbi:hypothetical protein A3D11_00345 [Candidatus Peribacteria bacterium RIFCSPHIGHO2_02_FULL_49_16]|nr:MAG: hypothetical protein A2880_02585 [Candidatus Peribacteria bacterium RIFCSPHIGHO2_01_FULL_49_38]OGJ59059.1 MAG: hypothetical protein A3D11_00345 [Candidatus Peribacteria bacterium RIFCSPHIGHO2_02_FULL_49_16]
MSYVIQYSGLLNPKDIARFPKVHLRKIKKAIEEKLIIHPEVFGKPLRFSLKGYRSLRVGAYRVIFRIDKDIVKILVIAHRSAVYKDYEGMLLY